MDNKRLSIILKLIANPERMAILMMLLESDRSLAELTRTVNRPATVISNHLSKLRTERIIAFTRYHRVIEYRLISHETAVILRTLIELKETGSA